jgi:hypothetical protein
MKAIFKRHLIVLLTLAASCSSCQCAETDNIAQTEPFLTIAQRNISKATLDRAIGQLEMPAKEPAQFWIGIANDSQNSDFQRRSAVFELFKRHVAVGMTLRKLAELLNHPTWITPIDVGIVSFIAGSMPIQFNLRDTFLVLCVLPRPTEDVSAIFLRVTNTDKHQSSEDKIEHFRSLIFGTTQSNIGNETIEEIGYGVPLSHGLSQQANQ